MKTILLPLLVTALLPAVAFAAPDAKGKKRPAAAHQDGPMAEVFKTFDKNGDHKIDADELPALQKAFSTLKNLDKNSNGEIELSEVEKPQASAAGDRKGRMLEHFKQIDKNGNHKIDADEVEGLQKLVADGKIMSRLDQNGNGKLEPGEVDRLNERLAQGFGGRGRPSASTAPSVRKAPEKPAESSKPEEKKDDKPAAPAPEPKPPGNFGV
jgi:Ca2+-binding EF-hand superfamily protein